MTTDFHQYELPTRRPANAPLMALALALLLAACTIQNPAVHRPNDVLPSFTSSLKVHLMSGDLVVLNNWSLTDSSLTGSGRRFGLDRRVGVSGIFTILRDSIALLETTRTTMSRAGPSIALMGVWTVLWSAITVTCLADPKACFGSCPTFYADGADGDVPQAEGFSASFARALEARDVDVLSGARPRGRSFGIRMTNEALETHAVRTLRLWAVPRPAGGRVFQGVDGSFYPAPNGVVAPARCLGPEGDCRPAVTGLDAVERRSLADSTDLAARELIELEFPEMSGRAGVVLGARQALVSTYLFYQTMAYLGRTAGDWLAALERSGPEQAQGALGMAQALGGIEVELMDAGGTWTPVGAYTEAGPIATDVVVIPMSSRPAGPIRLRLRMAKGAWRVNWVGVAALDDPVAPEVLDPLLVERDSKPDSAALALLLHPDRYLVTNPGDTYRIVYELPEWWDRAELFLESRGYYYEWMRGEWLKEEDLAMAALVLGDPHGALRRMAPQFKQAEPRMERLFWQSRFGR